MRSFNLEDTPACQAIVNVVVVVRDVVRQRRHLCFG